MIGGTRPEALKLAPLVRPLGSAGLRPIVVASGQHPTMFHQGLAAFGLKPDREVALIRETGSQAELVARLGTDFDELIDEVEPGAVVVQGDTSTALVGALAAFWRQIPVVHLEAGLRSFDLASPFPEEGNRKLIGQIASLHLAPTPAAAANLAREGVADAAVLTIGNTVVDAVRDVADRAELLRTATMDTVDEIVASGRRLVLVTVHRRESWGRPLEVIARTVHELLEQNPDVTVVLPAHPNPAVRDVVVDVLGAHPRALITEPLDYPDLVHVLRRSVLVLSDSGGIQEEAPTFGVPALVLRDRTERTEAIDAGCAILVGADRERILASANHLLNDEAARLARCASGNPFGDGLAGQRAARAISLLVRQSTLTAQLAGAGGSAVAVGR